MRTAIQPLTWGNTSFEEICKEIAAAGYQGVEPWVENYLDDLSPLRDILAANNLACTTTYRGLNLMDPSTREDEMAKEMRFAKALRELDAEVIIVSSPSRRVERNVSHDPAIIREFANHVNELCRRIKDETGVKAVFHNHIGTLVERPEEIDHFMEYTSPDLLYGGFDTAQLSAGGADPVEYFVRYAPRIKYVHLKDRQVGRPTYGNFCELGLGFIDIKTCVQVLKDAGYDGWLTAEVDQSLTTPYDSAVTCREYLRTHCGV